MRTHKMTRLAGLLSLIAALAFVLGHAERSRAVSRPPGPGSTTINLRLGESSKQSNVRVRDRVVCRGGGPWVATLVPRPYPDARAWAVAYNATLLASWNGQTLGKRLLGVQVLAADGTPLSFSRAVWRETGVRVFLLGGIGGLLGRVGASYGLACLVADFFLLVMHPERRALHDLLAGTRVIMAGRPPAAG